MHLSTDLAWSLADLIASSCARAGAYAVCIYVCHPAFRSSTRIPPPPHAMTFVLVLNTPPAMPDAALLPGFRYLCRRRKLTQGSQQPA